MNMRRMFAGLPAATAITWAAPTVVAEPVQLSFWYPVDLAAGSPR